VTNPAPAEAAAHPTREELHFRRIDLRGFRRSDGLYEVEANLTDRKPFDFQPPSREAKIAAGELIHDHVLRVAFGEDMVIREVATGMRTWPYDECPQGGESLQAMVGVRIGPGWNGEIRKRLPPGDTCTHLKEMLVVLASAAYQAVYGVGNGDRDVRDANGRPRKIDSCYAYGASRELVLRFWPEYHRASAE
jgi:hypothetical protein